jgi:manganese/iron transport system permease protein
MPSPVEALELPFMRLALAELALLAVAGGLLGGWIVLRGLAFFTHAVGTATFPGLVAADAAGISPQLAGMAVALGYTGGVERAGRAGRQPADAATGLLLAAALALGAVLASDVLEPGAGVDRLLFGTLVGLGGSDLALSAGAAALAVAGTLGAGRAWLALAFDPEGGRAIGRRAELADALLLAAVAVAVVAALPAVGALLVAAIFVVPAATVRLVAPSVPLLLAGGVALAAAEGAAGLYLAYWLDVSPGPAVALLGGGVFALTALGRRVARA